jgi:ribosome-binding protein aMBF1 (putative translation factor)
MTDEAKHIEEAGLAVRAGSSLPRPTKPPRKFSRPNLTVVHAELTQKQRRLRVRDKADLAQLIDKLVAKRIRTRRIDKGLTQQVLAQRVGVASQQIHKYESGISRITAGRLLQIAEALDFSVVDFFDFNGTIGRHSTSAGEKSTR